MGLPIIGAVAQVQNMPGFRAAVREVNSSLAGVQKNLAATSAAASGGEVGAAALSAMSAAAALVTAALAATLVAVLALAAGFATLVAHGVQVNASLEKVEIQLEGLTGMGRENLEWAKEMSTTTPFTPESVAQALQMAYAYGFQGEEAKKLVKVTADVSAAFGDQGDRMHRILIALGQMRGAGKVNAQDMRQLTEAGIEAWRILADHIGVSVSEVRKMVTDGLVSSDIAVGVFTQALEDKFGGAAERTASSMQGVLGNIQNIVDLASAEISFPVFDILRQTLAGIRDELKGTEYQELIKDTASLMRDLTQDIDPREIVRFFRNIVDGARDALQFVRQLRNEILGVTAGDLMADATGIVESNNALLEDSYARLKTSHEDIMAGLQEEAAALLDQQATLQSSSDEDAQANMQRNAAQLEAVQQRIADENAAYEQQRIELRTANEEENTRVLEDANKQAAALGEGPAAAIGNFIKEAGETITNVWESVKQTFMDVWESPAFRQLRDWFTAKGPETMEAFRKIWDEHLRPAFEKIDKLWQERVVPHLKEMATWIKDHLNIDLMRADGIVHTLDLTFYILINTLDALATAFEAVVNFIDRAISSWDRFRANISNFSLPNILTPGSPTPFETAIRGISSAIDELSVMKLPDLAQSVNAMAGAAVGVPTMMENAAMAHLTTNNVGGSQDNSQTTIDRRINVQANYSKTQSEGSIFKDVRLAQILQQG